MRNFVKLVCTECGSENYYTDRNRKNVKEPLQLKKYCKKQRKTTLHKEKR